MSYIPDLCGLKKGESFVCGTDMKFNPQAEIIISRICFDCGRYFDSAKNKMKHVKDAHPKSNDDGNNATICEVCKYKKRSKDCHYIIVRAKHLQLPEEYPVAVDAVDSGDEVADEAQPQEADEADEAGEHQ